jgi:hypothetical protein
MQQGDMSADFERTLLLVGRLNYAWTNTESVLIHLIAGLAGTSKNTALIIFLTLNTTRARIDLVERLAKTNASDAQERDRVLDLTRRFSKLSGLRNRYNHCIYSFDPGGGAPRSIQMRISDRRETIKMGHTEHLDAAARREIETAIEDISDVNRAAWSVVAQYRYPS